VSGFSRRRRRSRPARSAQTAFALEAGAARRRGVFRLERGDVVAKLAHIFPQRRRPAAHRGLQHVQPRADGPQRVEDLAGVQLEARVCVEDDASDERRRASRRALVETRMEETRVIGVRSSNVYEASDVVCRRALSR